VAGARRPKGPPVVRLPRLSATREGTGVINAPCGRESDRATQTMAVTVCVCSVSPLGHQLMHTDRDPLSRFLAAGPIGARTRVLRQPSRSRRRSARSSPRAQPRVPPSRDRRCPPLDAAPCEPGGTAHRMPAASGRRRWAGTRTPHGGLPAPARTPPGSGCCRAPRHPVRRRWPPWRGSPGSRLRYRLSTRGPLKVLLEAAQSANRSARVLPDECGACGDKTVTAA
jgi:hypothetical protein